MLKRLSLRRNILVGIALLLCLTLIAQPSLAVPGTSDAAAAAPTRITPLPTVTANYPKLLNKADKQGKVRLIVGLNAQFVPKPSAHAAFVQQVGVQKVRQQVLDTVNTASSATVTTKSTNWSIPYVAISTDKAGLQALMNSPQVTSVVEDRPLISLDQDSDTLIGAPTVWNAGYAGLNTAVAVLDTGVQANHPFFGSRVIGEACFSTNDPANGLTSLCPNGQTSQFGVGAAAPCADTCNHGTHVAGIAGGYGAYSGGIGYSGVAISANIVAVQVFTRTPGGISAYDADIISGLNWIYANNASYHIAAVNMSLGSSADGSSGYCDTTNSAMTSAINALKSIGVATIIASGNDGSSTKINYPACISSAISVGAVGNGGAKCGFDNTADSVAFFSDSDPKLSLLAPGVCIASSFPGSTYGYDTGTSMATPQVAGAFALLKSRLPNDSVDQLLAVLRNSGKPITDTRNNVTTPRIRLDQSLYIMASRQRTVGTYDRAKGVFYLRDSNTTGYADQSIAFGPTTTTYPIVGDWTGSGIDTLGVYDQSTGVFYLRNSNTTGYADETFTLGLPGDIPLAGRWNGQMTHDGVGVFRPSNGLIYLKNDLSTGYADETMVLGIPGDIGLTGDWNGDGIDTPGVYRPSNSTFYMSYKVCNCAVIADQQFTFGTSYLSPVVGNWAGDGLDTLGVGVFDSQSAVFSLRNTLNQAYTNPDSAFTFGSTRFIPIAGKWAASAPLPSALTKMGIIVTPTALPPTAHP